MAEVTLALTMPEEAANILRAQARVHNQGLGEYVASLLAQMPDRFGGCRATRANAILPQEPGRM
jgi:hypothetical protein